MSTSAGEDHWYWDDRGTPDHKHDRRRVFHKSIVLRNGEDDSTRRFSVGDTVNMAGGEDTWVAQIIDLFQVNAQDPELRQLLRTDSLKSESKHHYELKRCTLRWFYNFNDMRRTSLRSAKWPKCLEDEIWYSDHIEKPGYNSVQVIDGRAWLFDNMREKNEFLEDPPEDYAPERDVIRIVRGFVDSKRDTLPARLLYDGELKWLQSNPSDDRNLYYISKSRFERRSSSPSKSKKPKYRHTSLREPVNVDEDEFDPTDVSSKPQKGKHRAHQARSVQEVSRLRRPVRRRKVTIDEDEESTTQDAEDDPNDNIPLSQLRPSQPKPSEQPTNIALLNDEVRDLVESLNASAFAEDVPETPSEPPEQPETNASRPYAAVDEDEITPAPPKPKSQRKPLVQKGRSMSTISPTSKKLPQKPIPPTNNDEAIIIIDSDEEEPPPKVQPQRSPPKLQRFHPGAANRAYRGGRHGKPSARNRSSFMPTSRERPSSSSRKHVDPQREESRRAPSSPGVDTAQRPKRLPRSKDAPDEKVEPPGRPKEGKTAHVKDSDNLSTAVRNSNLEDSEEITPVNGSKANAEGRGTKRVAADDIGQHQSAAKRRSLGSIAKKPRALESRPEKVKVTEHTADARMKDVAKSASDKNSGTRISERPAARKMVSDNVIDVNDSDTEPDDRGLQEDGPSVFKITQDQRKLTDNFYRIHARMNAVDKDFLSEKLEWIIDEVVRFHDGQKGSLNEEEYERVLRDQLVQKRVREIGSLQEIPVFESDSQPKHVSEVRERD